MAQSALSCYPCDILRAIQVMDGGYNRPEEAKSPLTQAVAPSMLHSESPPSLPLSPEAGGDSAWEGRGWGWLGPAHGLGWCSGHLVSQGSGGRCPRGQVRPASQDSGRPARRGLASWWSRARGGSGEQASAQVGSAGLLQPVGGWRGYGSLAGKRGGAGEGPQAGSGG